MDDYAMNVTIDPVLPGLIKQELRQIILEILQEDLENGGIIAPFISTEQLKEYVAKEVRKALREECAQLRKQTGAR